MEDYTMVDKSIRLKITIDAGKDADEEELDRLTIQVMKDLKSLDVESVERPTIEKNLPDGCKPGLLFAPGVLTATLSTAGGVLSTLIGTLQPRIAGKERKITLEIKGDKLVLESITDEQQQHLIDYFIRSHTDSGCT